MSVESATACKDIELCPEEHPKLSSTMSALGNQQKEHLLRQLDRLKQDLNEKFMACPRAEGSLVHTEYLMHISF